MENGLITPTKTLLPCHITITGVTSHHMHKSTCPTSSHSTGGNSTLRRVELLEAIVEFFLSQYPRDFCFWSLTLLSDQAELQSNKGSVFSGTLHLEDARGLELNDCQSGSLSLRKWEPGQGLGVQGLDAHLAGTVPEQ